NFLVALVLLELVATMLLAKAARETPRLVFYLGAEMLATAIILAASTSSALDSRRYIIAYILARVIGLTGALNLGRPRPIAILFALAASMIVLSYPSAAYTTFGLIASVEGVLFLLAGVSLTLATSRTIPGTIAILWLLLAIFDFCYAAQWQLTVWAEL